MRWWVCVFLLMVSVDVRAGEVFLIPENNPKPVYPVALYRAGVIGKVRVSLTVQADGSVSKVVILEDAHPELGEASVAAVSQWRFKPWKITEDQPAQVSVIAPMDFRLDSEHPFHVNKELERLKCSAIARASLNIATSSWVDLPVFRWTRSYLTHSLSPTQLPEEKRLALIAKLNASAHSIVQRCNVHPASRYVHFLPEEIRVLL
ncbi:energy transducer TonB [Pseudomonas sp. R37(2017)]|uniref:energy transducer TonB n=1 Tax=Pseudomonas sp. R37(2017) TaxID=1981685 RepID=UPI000A1FFC75|nr:energy transducer TonB [Pseudomonas sp. R37(2017)]